MAFDSKVWKAFKWTDESFWILEWALHEPRDPLSLSKQTISKIVQFELSVLANTQVWNPERIFGEML